MDASRILTVPAAYMDMITKELDPAKELAGLLPYLSGRIVEVFCRTGRLGEYLLAKGYQWQGCDPDSSMIEYSIQRVGFNVQDIRVPHTNSADTILGLFAPFSYTPPEELAGFAQGIHDALTEKGRAIFELWFTPETAKPYYSIMDTYETSTVKLVRAVVPILKGSQAIFDFHWLVGTTGNVERQNVTVTRYLHSNADIESAFSIFKQEWITIADRRYLLLSKNIS